MGSCWWNRTRVGDKCMLIVRVMEMGVIGELRTEKKRGLGDIMIGIARVKVV